MICDWHGVLPYLTGLANLGLYDIKHWDFILSNGCRFQQKQAGVTWHDKMMPEGAYKKIRSVRIYDNDISIIGFCFFDKDGKQIWMIGDNYQGYDVRTVLIKDNEVIVGVKAKVFRVS